MADDIDIEEHDVLDNPRIKDLFPELTRIKFQVPDNNDEGQPMQNDLGGDSGISSETPLHCNQPLHKNHITLGKKSIVDRINFEDDQTISNSQFNEDNDVDNRNLQKCHIDYELGHNIKIKQESEDSHNVKIERYGSCIKLGSNPNGSAPEKESLDLHNSVVVIENWGPRLQRSNRYCKDCKILFDTRNCLDTHNTDTHSFLVPLSNDPESPDKSQTGQATIPVNKARKSTAKNLQFSRKSSLSDRSTSNEKLSQQTASSNLTAQKSSCNTETELIRHDESHHTEDEHEDDDTSDKSNDGLYFRCDVCFCYFRYISQHMKKNHGKNTFSTKRVPFLGDCKYCESKFSTSRNLIKHVKKNHSKHFKKPVSSKVLTKKTIKKAVKDQKKFVYNGVSNPPIPKSVLFKCNNCQFYFTILQDAVNHSCKCNDNADVWKCDVCSKRFFGKKFVNKIIHERQHIISDRFIVHLIDKSLYKRTLCQCPKCKVYYSEQEFWVHVKQGCGQPRSVACKICNIHIHFSSTQMHERLHENTNFNAEDLILIEFVPFENKYTEGNENIFIRNKRKILEYNNASDPKKRRISTSSQGETKPLRKICKIIYYCETCKTYWTASRGKTYHLTGKCKIPSKCARVCKKCGLFFSSRHHDITIHKSDKTIFDYTFIRVQDNEIINPMPSYPMCSKCEIHFFNKKARLQHDCNNATTEHKICEFCKERFSVEAYRLHVTFHEYVLRKFNNKVNRSMAENSLPVMEKSSILSPVTESLSGKSPQTPELKNYKLSTQNILYSCEVCDIVCNSYDRMVDHSQDHFNKVEGNDTIKNCEICDLRFDATSFDEHRDLHVENTTLSRQSFKILKYNYMNLFSDNWFELFGPLPRASIVSQSIYVFDRNIRMRITQHGPPENTVYKCGRCNGYLTASKVRAHFVKSICWHPRYKCKLCHLAFSKNACLIEHENVCRITQQTFREVIFNDINDVTFNKGLQVKQQSEKPSTDMTQIKARGPIYRLYKCEICKCCVKSKPEIKFHKCSKPSVRVKCIQCDLFFNKQFLYRHKTLHMKLPKLSKRTVMTIPFKPESSKVLHAPNKNIEKTRKSVTMYKLSEKNKSTVNLSNYDNTIYLCRCGLHFLRLKTFKKHIPMCNGEICASGSKANCEICGLLFSARSLSLHQYIQHESLSFKLEDLRILTERNIKQSNVTQSKTLPVHNYLDGVSSVSEIDSTEKENLTSKTSEVLTITSHKTIQLSNYIYNADLDYSSTVGHTNTTQQEQTPPKTADGSISIESVRPSKLSYNLSEKRLSSLNIHNFSNQLYKCKVCNKHYINLHTGLKHRHNAREEKCDICGLIFTGQIMSKHQNVHHVRLGLNLADFHIHHVPQKTGILNCKNQLYKCDVCDTHFFRFTSAHAHTHERCTMTISKRDLICKDCGLNFSECSLQTHAIEHHLKNKLKAEDFNIIHYSGATRKTKSHDNTDTGDISSITNSTVFDESGISPGKTEESEKGDVDSSKTSEVLESTVISHKTIRLSNYSCNADLDNSRTVGHTDTTQQEHTPPKTADGSISIESVRPSKLSYNLSEKRLSSLNIHNYSNQLYKCKVCNKHYIYLHTGLKHRHDAREEKCDICGLIFTSQIMSKHQYVHHERLGLNLADFHIHLVPQKSENLKCKNQLYKCDICGTHFLKFTSAHAHTDELCTITISKRDLICKDCGINFSECSLQTHAIKHHLKNKLNAEDFNIIHYSGATRKTKSHGNTDMEDISSITNSTDFDESGISTGKTKEPEKEDVDPLEISEVLESTATSHKAVRISEYSYDADLDNSSYLGYTDTTQQEHTPTLSESHLASNMENFSNQLYKCKVCKKHFIYLDTGLRHRHDTCGAKCDTCGLIFTGHIVSKHQYIHHERLGLNLADFHIHHVSQETENLNCKNLLYKCDICDTHFLKFTSAHAHTDERCTMTIGKRFCKDCGLNFSECSFPTHAIEHHSKSKLKTEDFYIIHYSGATRKTKSLGNTGTMDISSITNCTDFDESVISTEKTDETEKGDFDQSETDLDSNVSKPTKFSFEKAPTRLYKCGDCNVYYITQKSCYKHMLSHKKLDFKEYIECKLCGLQFLIGTLRKHMFKHHKVGFDLKNLLVEEYHATNDNSLKIFDIYIAQDKIQARLVSTTTDSKDVSEGKVDSTVDDVVRPVNNDQEHVGKDSTYECKIDQLTVTKNLAQTNNNPVRDQIVLESTVKEFTNNITVKTLSKNTSREDSCPHVDQVELTSNQSVENITDSVVCKTESDVTVEIKRNQSAKQADSKSDVLDLTQTDFIVPLIDLTEDD